MTDNATSDAAASAPRIPHAVQATHELLIWLVPLLDQFPRTRRHGLGERLQTALLDVLALFGRIIDSYGRCTADAQAAEPFPGDDLLTAIDRPCGIPIGNLTSQFLANLYLDTLDHTIKQRWKVPAYLRYVDDLIFLADDKALLWDVRARLEEELAQLRLRLHPAKVHLMRTAERVDVLGYMVSPGRRWLRNDNGYRFRRRLRAMLHAHGEGRSNWEDIQPRIAAWVGHARHGETDGLRKALFSSQRLPHIL